MPRDYVKDVVYYLFNYDSKYGFYINKNTVIKKHGNVNKLMYGGISYNKKIIAGVEKGGPLYITNNGIKSNAIKTLLNALPGVEIKTNKGEWILNGELWDGSWVRIDIPKP